MLYKDILKIIIKTYQEFGIFTFEMRLVLFFSVFLTFVFSYSQNTETKIVHLYQKYENVARTKPDSALIYLKEAQKINQTLQNKNFEARITYGLGYTYYTLRDYDKALINFNKSIDIAKEINNDNVLSKSYNQIGLIYSHQNKIRIALEYFQKSLKISESRKELKDNTISVFTNIADLYIMQQDTINARRYYQQARKLGEIEDNNVNLAAIYNNVAVSYMTTDKDSTEFYLTKAINLYKATGNTYGQILAQNNLSTTILNFNSVEDYRLAEELLMESLRLSKEIKNTEAEFFSNFYLGNFYEKGTNNFIKALEYYKNAYQLIKEGYKNESTVELYKRMSTTYYKLGDFQNAYKYQTVQHKLQDSIFSVEKNKQFIETLTEFDVERKNNQIQLLNKEKEIQRASKQMILLVALLLIVPLTLLAFFYKKRLIYQETISNQDKLIFEQEKESIRVKNLIIGQKQERTRIARELHDGVGGKMSAITIKMDQINTIDVKNDELKECIAQLQDTAKEIRMISHELDDSELGEMSLVVSLKQLIKDYQLFFSGEIYLSIFPVDKFEEINDFRKHFLYRIIQEIMSNTIKYAEAKNINIDCTFDDKFRFIIEDDGKGFDVEGIKKGMGLKNIYKRTGMMNGEVHIDSVPGRGTTFIIEIPEKNE